MPILPKGVLEFDRKRVKLGAPLGEFMPVRGSGATWRFYVCLAVALGPVLLTSGGCAKDRAAVSRDLMAQNASQRRAGVLDSYTLRCPDVIDVTIENHPELSKSYSIGADGRIDLGDYGNPRIEGKTLPAVVRLLSEETGTPAPQVRVRVAEFRSQYLLLFGEVNGSQRSVPYRGQETVLDLLQRVGGITIGAEPRDVYVVRSHLGDNQRPEVFHVDLQAIVLKNDAKTNIRLLPYDQVYVGETKRAQIEKAIPTWMRSIYLPFLDRKKAADAKRPKDAPAGSPWMQGAP